MEHLNHKIYLNSPIFVKNIMLSFYHLKKYRQRYGGIYKEYSKFLNDAQYWSADKIREYQNNRIKNILVFSYENTKYYKKIFDEISFSPYKIKDQEELQKLPILNKKIIAENYNDIIPNKWLKKTNYFIKKTSGTTGTPLQFPATYNSAQSDYATQDFVWKIFTKKKFKNIKTAYFAGHQIKNIDDLNPPFWAYNYLTKTMYFSSYHLSYQSISSYIKKLIKFNPESIAGYPSSLYFICNFIKHENINIHIPYIWTSSETLLPHQQEVISKALGGRINNFYGCTEGIGPSFICNNNNNHLLENSSIVYKKNDKVTFTNFENYAFPFINYQLNDFILYDEKKCKCGRHGKILSTINGRQEDYVITKDKRHIGRLDHLFKDVNNIVESQIIQEKIGEIIINIVKHNEYNKEEELKIIKNAFHRLGKNTDIKINYIKKIPRTNNGKFKFVISKINIE